jgi:hypothetical protein
MAKLKRTATLQDMVADLLTQQSASDRVGKDIARDTSMSKHVEGSLMENPVGHLLVKHPVGHL